MIDYTELMIAHNTADASPHVVPEDWYREEGYDGEGLERFALEQAKMLLASNREHGGGHPLVSMVMAIIYGIRIGRMAEQHTSSLSV